MQTGILRYPIKLIKQRTKTSTSQTIVGLAIYLQEFTAVFGINRKEFERQ